VHWYRTELAEGPTQMTGSDLIVLVPWLVFAMVLAVICALLVRR
jgi:hypothetical protein